MQQVALAAGDSETFGSGYHTLEFAEPVRINSNQFAVVVEITGTRSIIDLVTEGVIEETDQFDYAKTETDRCFVASKADFDNCVWFDLGTIGNQAAGLVNCDSPLKAFTVTSVQDASVDSIEIVIPPNKTEYKEGEDFDKTGMKVRVLFNDNTAMYLEDSDYSISNGTNLKLNQTSVTIEYMGKTVEQPITVVENEQKPEPEKDDEPAKNSSFSNAICTLAEIKAFYYDDGSSYSIIDTEISEVIRDMNNDTYEYYYYLSPKSNLTSISDWVKVSEDQDSNTKLKFKVDSRSLSNYDDIAKAETLYIYIKETVTKGGNQSVAISKAIRYKLDSNTSIDTYVNGGKTGTYNAPNQPTPSSGETTSSGSSQQGASNQPQASESSQVPATTSSSASKLPYTGGGLIILGIVILIIVGIVVFVRYEVLNRYVK